MFHLNVSDFTSRHGVTSHKTLISTFILYTQIFFNGLHGQIVLDVQVMPL
jgi:hypothetical protein